MSESLTWNGDALTAKMRQAQKLGVNKTMSECVVHAKANHPWKNQTGILEGSISIADFAHDIENGVEGVWGSKDVKYARIHELGGVIEHPGGTPYLIGEDGLAVFVRKDHPDAADLPKTKPHQITMPKRPYLRPAADEKYPELAVNVKAAFDKISGPSKPAAAGSEA